MIIYDLSLWLYHLSLSLPPFLSISILLYIYVYIDEFGITYQAIQPLLSNQGESLSYSSNHQQQQSSSSFNALDQFTEDIAQRLLSAAINNNAANSNNINSIAIHDDYHDCVVADDDADDEFDIDLPGDGDIAKQHEDDDDNNAIKKVTTDLTFLCLSLIMIMIIVLEVIMMMMMMMMIMMLLMMMMMMMMVIMIMMAIQYNSLYRH